MRSRRAIPILLLTGALGSCGDGSTPAGPSSPPTTREGRWEQDLDTLARVLPDRHPDLFFRITRERFESEVAELRASIPSLSNSAIVTGMMRILALVGDSHTTIDTNRWTGFRQLPVRFGWFRDGIFVIAATEPFREALGGKLLRVGEAPLEAAIEALREVIPHENDSWLRFKLVSTLTVPEVLEAQSIVADASRVRLELADVGGERLVVEVPAEPRGPLDLVEVGSGPLPLHRQRSGDNYWLTVLESSQTLYIHYRRAADMQPEPFSSFAERALRLLDANPIRAVVVDLRHNTGGNSSLLEPFLRGLEARPEWSGGDGLYTIIGRATFSSGLLNAFSLRERARAVLVGEPTGGKPNHFGEVRSFTLPTSGLRVQHSTRFFRILDDADPPSLAPDIRVEPSSKDFIERRDPVLETILGFVGN